MKGSGPEVIGIQKVSKLLVQHCSTACKSFSHSMGGMQHQKKELSREVKESPEADE